MMRRVAQVFGLFFALVSIVLLIVSMVEKVKWVRITVDPSKLTSGIQINKLAYYSRERGIFKECWTNEKLDSMIRSNPYYNDDKLCLDLDLRVRDRRKDTVYQEEYLMRAGFMLGVPVLFALTLLLSLVGFVCFLFTLCKRTDDKGWQKVSKTTGTLFLVAALMNGLGMGFFHIAEYLELNVVKDMNKEGLQASFPGYFPTGQSDQELFMATSRMYDWGYGICWLSMACLICAAVLFYISSCCRYPKKEQLMTYKSNTSNGSVMKQYEVPVVMGPPIYKLEGYYDNHGGQKFFDPYSDRKNFSAIYSQNNGWTIR